MVWVLKVILFECVYGVSIDAVVFCDDVTKVYGKLVLWIKKKTRAVPLKPLWAFIFCSRVRFNFYAITFWTFPRQTKAREVLPAPRDETLVRPSELFVSRESRSTKRRQIL